MGGVLQTLWEGLSNALLMAWTVWWALVLGFALSAIVQAWVPAREVEGSLGGKGWRPVLLATGLGAASSSCSYAAIAIAKSLYQKGASAVSALAFQFASTNLVFELGIVIWVLLGWQFTLAEFVGGLLLVAIMAVLARAFVPPRVEEPAREHARAAEGGHQHRSAASRLALRERLRSAEAWSDVAHNFRNDWAMLWKEICLGFVIAGFIGLLGDSFFDRLFASGAPAGLRLLENVIVGPVIAILSFVCSVGNVPIAAVLWSGGITFGGVVAFVFADLLIVPIVLAYRKYYGTGFTMRITALMFVTIVLAALAVDLVFVGAGLVPRARPSRAEVFGSVRVDYKLFANVLAAAAFATLFSLTMRRGEADPVCGMRVDRARAPALRDGDRTRYFCSERCMREFSARRAESRERRP